MHLAPFEYDWPTVFEVKTKQAEPIFELKQFKHSVGQNFRVSRYAANRFEICRKLGRNLQVRYAIKVNKPIETRISFLELNAFSNWTYDMDTTR